jgi:hypothetical protein
MTAKHDSLDLGARQPPAPDFLDHLCDVFGWSREEAMAALGDFILSSRAGRALLRDEAAEECNQSVEAA